jgi:hypothetical protein
MNTRSFQVHPTDNVATLIDDARGGQSVQVLGPGARVITAGEPIAQGHKIALRDIGADEPVIKFGVPIGRATKPIRAGDWVHLHNCMSNFDQRSQTLDVHSGATTDTKYE